MMVGRRSSSPSSSSHSTIKSYDSFVPHLFKAMLGIIEIDLKIKKSLRWGHGDLNAGHRTPSPVGYQATLWPRAADGRM